MKRAKLSPLKFSQIKTLISCNSYTQALKSSLTLSPFSPILTDLTYALFIKAGNFLHPFLSASLISGFARFSKPVTVFRLFNELRDLGLVPDLFTLSSLIKGCDDFRKNEIAHGFCVRLGFGFNGFILSGLIENYSKNRDVGSAEKCFQECFDADNVVYTAMLCGYMSNEEFGRGKETFAAMRDLGLELNGFSLTGVVGGLFDVREGDQVHGFAIKMGFLYEFSLHLCNAVMSMYCRCGCKMDAIKLFDEIPEPDIVSWTERIGAARDGEEALECLRILHSAGLDLNEYTFINVLTAIGSVKFILAGKQIQALCHKKGYFQVVSVGNALMSMYGKCGQPYDARNVFDYMISRDYVSWNSLISVFSENGLVNEALGVFSHMRGFELNPTIYTLVSILEIASTMNCSKKAMQIHSHVIKSGFLSDDSMVSSLITAYWRCNSVDESKRIFNEIPEVNAVHTNAMMTNLVHSGSYADALEMFWRSHLGVDSKTFSIVLKACSSMTDLEQGRQIQSLALRSGFLRDSFVESALIDFYCKCGDIRDAEKAFRNTSKHNLVAWNAMIMGYAQHGYCKNVAMIFDEMTRFGVEPDEITYLGVLTSCCHAGQVREAWYYFKHMFEIRVIPCLEHYACLVDLLGRLGFLEDAKEIIDHMHIQPDVQIWQILLSACKIHGHVELGRVAASKILELQPENESAYILLSNLYASAGMWDAVGNLRKEMKEKVLYKEPGSSSIQIGGMIHKFLVHDGLHPLNKEIYMELFRLYVHMKTLLELEDDSVFYESIHYVA